MSRRSQQPKRIRYKQDYVSYWNSKGTYGIERVTRMERRKHARYLKLIKKREDRRRNYCPYCGRYGCDEDRW